MRPSHLPTTAMWVVQSMVVISLLRCVRRARVGYSTASHPLHCTVRPYQLAIAIHRLRSCYPHFPISLWYVCTQDRQRLPYPSAHPASAASQPLGVFATRPRLKRTNLGCSRDKACGRSQMLCRPKPNRTLAARTLASDPFVLIPPAYRYQ
jgi:hypothetical protein